MRGHLPAGDHGVMDPEPALYTIRINGHLGATLLSAFPAMAARPDGAHTVLTGPLDRSALYGVLAEIEALGLDLLEVRQLTPGCESPAGALPRAAPRRWEECIGVPAEEGSQPGERRLRPCRRGCGKRGHTCATPTR